MDSSVSIVSVNCQGLNNKQKRRDTFHYLKSKKHSIYFLQDTHFEDKMERYILSERGYQGYFSNYASNSRGVAILFNNNFEFKVKRLYKGNDGNSLMVHMVVNQTDYLLVNIYGPNRDDPEFYSNLTQKIKNFDIRNVIIAGDFNLVLDPTRDYCNYKNINNPKGKEMVDTMIDDLDLTDIWRDLNPDCHRFTWRRSNPFQQARLDFFLVSDHVVSLVEDAEIECGYRTDHSMILLKLKFNEKSKRNTFWKFNSSLLKDKLFLEEINEEIKNVKLEYALSPYARESIEDIPISELQLSISDDLFLDFLLMKIRSKTISYAAMKKKKSHEEEHKLEEEIKLLLNKNIQNEEEVKEIEAKKGQLKLIREKRIEGVLLRSRARWVEKGEKVTNYFCSLEKRHYVSKSMNKLIDKQGNTIHDHKEIAQEVQTFYKALYEERLVDDCKVEDLVKSIPALDVNEASSLDGEIDLEEATFVLKNMKNNKSPGSDGFTVEFF